MVSVRSGGGCGFQLPGVCFASPKPHRMAGGRRPNAAESSAGMGNWHVCHSVGPGAEAKGGSRSHLWRILYVSCLVEPGGGGQRRQQVPRAWCPSIESRVACSVRFLRACLEASGSAARAGRGRWELRHPPPSRHVTASSRSGGRTATRSPAAQRRFLPGVTRRGFP